MKVMLRKKLHASCGNRGFALLLVVVIMLLVSFLASQLILQVRTEAKVVYNVKARTSAAYLGQGGVNLALFRLFDHPVDYLGDEYVQFVRGQIYETELDSGSIKYLAVSENGKIDLNKSNRRLMELYLDYLGLEMEERDIIVASWIDWKDQDDLLTPPHGAEKKTYEEFEIPYIPQNGPIKDPSEFLLFYGMEAVKQPLPLEEIFTVHNSQNGKIDINSLTPAMLGFITNDDEEMQEAYWEAMSLYGKITMVQAQQIFGEERYGLFGPYLIAGDGKGSAYGIIAWGQTMTGPEGEKKAAGPTCRIDVLIKKNQLGDFEVISWKEQYI